MLCACIFLLVLFWNFMSEAEMLMCLRLFIIINYYAFIYFKFWGGV